VTSLLQGTVLGLPQKLDENHATALRSFLDQTWTTVTGKRPGELSDDLQVCKRWFDPIAQGQRLRRELADLPQIGDAGDPGPPLTFNVGSGRLLVTPEGRCALHLLERFRGSPNLMLSDTDFLPYDRLLADLYRGWSRHRIQSVVDLLRGAEKPLQIPAAGVVLALLVNRCTSEDRALIRYPSGKPRDVVDRAFFKSVQAFADVLAPKSRANRMNPQLVSGWMLYEARRRLGDAMVTVDARGGHMGRVWIRQEQIDYVVSIVARDLMRGHRSRPSSSMVAKAFDSLVAALRSELPNLAGYGAVHERPPETVALRGKLVDALVNTAPALA
jgi:hypothetical protein